MARKIAFVGKQPRKRKIEAIDTNSIEDIPQYNPPPNYSWLILIVLLLIISFAVYRYYTPANQQYQNNYLKIYYDDELNVLWLNNLSQVHALCQCDNCTTCENKYIINQIFSKNDNP